MSLDSAKSMLESLWRDQEYLECRGVIYDLGTLAALPDLNEMMALSSYIARNKKGRGPRNIVFVASAFTEKSVANVFAGFAKVVGLKLSFCPSLEKAYELMDKHLGNLEEPQ